MLAKLRQGLLHLVALALLVGSVAKPANAQRGAFGVASIPGNPFQAELLTTMSLPGEESQISQSQEFVSRDGEGRVRIDVPMGKFKIKTGADAGKEVENHNISIYDPATGLTVRLDTVNKTARTVNPAGTPKSGSPQPRREFCHKYGSSLGNLSSEDLGRKMIQGFDAQGVRITTNRVGANGEPLPPTVREEWCSEELGAFMVQVMNSPNGGFRREITLMNIERHEPDAALFEIPPDYTVLESVPEPAPISPSAKHPK
jgi:hypothetical protein